MDPASPPNLLAPFDAAALEEDTATIYAVQPDLRIGYVNRQWTRFADDNGASWTEPAWGVGTRVTDAIPEVLRPFYEGLFHEAFVTKKVIEHDYDCSSPTLHRRFRMRLHPCTSGAVLVSHSLLRESAHPTVVDGALAELDSLYRRADGLVNQCCHCRQVQRTSGAGAWEFVPLFVAETPRNTSHGLCELCFEYYYPEPSET
jgi:hypothetical protein